MLALLRNDQAAAIRAFERSAAILREVPNAEPANFRGVWLLVQAAIGDQRAAGNLKAAYEWDSPRPLPTVGWPATRRRSWLAGPRTPTGPPSWPKPGSETCAGFPVWADLARMYAAEAALADGWREPRRWLASGSHGHDVPREHILAELVTL